MSGGVISGDSITSIADWDVPVVDAGGEDGEAGGVSPVTAQELEELHEQARQEGYRAGWREGMEAAQRELAVRVAELEGLLAALARPLEQVDEEVEQQLLGLALTVAKQLVRRELRTEPGEVLAAIREALAVLPAGVRNVRLHLHPEDAALVREKLSLGEQERSWQIVEDPVLTRGGCRVVSDTSRIDASVEHRMNAVIAAVLGDERRPAGEDQT